MSRRSKKCAELLVCFLKEVQDEVVHFHTHDVCTYCTLWETHKIKRGTHVYKVPSVQ